MKNSTRPLRPSTLALALALAGALSAAEAAPAPAVQEKRTATLELAKRTFKKLDANKDGKVSLAEAGRTGVPAKAFNAQDADADKLLSESEFILLYRDLLASGGYPIASDLEQAVKGIQADRKRQADLDAKRIEEARRKQAQDSAEARTTAARKQQAELDAKRTQDARKKQAQDSAEARTTAARKQQAELDAKRIEEARKKQAQDSAEARTTAARKKQAELDAKRVEEARKKQADGGDKADAKKPTPVPTKPKKVKKPRTPEDGTAPPSQGAAKGRAASGGSDGA